MYQKKKNLLPIKLILLVLTAISVLAFGSSIGPGKVYAEDDDTWVIKADYPVVGDTLGSVCDSIDEYNEADGLTVTRNRVKYSQFDSVTRLYTIEAFSYTVMEKNSSYSLSMALSYREFPKNDATEDVLKGKKYKVEYVTPDGQPNKTVSISGTSVKVSYVSPNWVIEFPIEISPMYSLKVYDINWPDISAFEDGKEVPVASDFSVDGDQHSISGVTWKDGANNEITEFEGGDDYTVEFKIQFKFSYIEYPKGGKYPDVKLTSTPFSSNPLYTQEYDPSTRTLTLTVINGVPVKKKIKNLSVAGITTPEIGAAPATPDITITSTESIASNPLVMDVNSAEWSPSDTEFKYGTHYTLTIKGSMNEDQTRFYSWDDFTDGVTLNAGTLEDKKITSDGSIELKVGFDTPKDKFQISFDANGGSGTMEPVTVENGKTYTLPESTFTAPEGKEFDKWDKGAAGSSFTVTEDVVIKAVWKDKEAAKPADIPATDPTAKPVDDPASNPTKKPSETPTTASSSETPVAEVKAGDTATVDGASYVIGDDKTAAYTAPENTAATAIVVPDTITVNNTKYTVTEISAKAYKNNKKLKSVTIGKNVTSIGASAFEGCTALTKVVIPAKVKKIGKKAFYGCKKLKNVTIKTKKLTDKTVGSKAFGKIHSKAVVKVPKAKLKAYKKILKKKGISGKKQKIKK